MEKKVQDKKQIINDLIFKELIKRGYSLEGNTRVWNIADSKLWYLTPEQSQSYLDLEDSENFKELASNSEFELLQKNISDIKEVLGTNTINVVDLGCGDGKKAAYIVERLGKEIKVRYCPIDISGYMVQKAIGTFSKKNIAEVVSFQYNISDFENLENLTPLLRSGEYKKSLFLLLGYTLGNFEVNEILYQIRGAMKEGDILVLVSGVANKSWEEWAKTVTDISKMKMNAFFVHIPLQLGLSLNDVKFGARYRNGRVEYYYTLQKNATISFQGREVHFDQGDQIIVAVAYKHKKEDLLTYLNMYFNQVSMSLSKDKATILAICKK